MGFPMRCDAISDTIQNGKDMVSIPYGFSNALRRGITQITNTGIDVFQSLMGFPMRCDPERWIIGSAGGTVFQSLMGFPMRCDGSRWQWERLRETFQSLMGFPMRCDKTIPMGDDGHLGVSIPYGFSNALRR